MRVRRNENNVQIAREPVQRIAHAIVRGIVDVVPQLTAPHRNHLRGHCHPLLFFEETNRSEPPTGIHVCPKVPPLYFTARAGRQPEA